MCKANKLRKLPNVFDGISIIYFHNENRNRYVKLPADQALAKQLARVIYHDVKTTISKNKQKEQAK